ncbi:NEL-type E3 ubiquitin ligase domain-containing protein [Pseudomonas sp. LF245]
MPNHHLLNGLSGHLQSSESWGRQQALELLRHILAQSMNSLTLEQQREYVSLQRNAIAALKAVESENTRLVEQFKTSGLAQLRSKLGGLDPQKIFINTRYLEKLDTPLPWEPRSSAIGGLTQSPRFRRAVDEWKYRAHVSRMSLWEAACLNFDFGTGNPQASGHSYVDASYLTGVDEKQLSVSQFIAICRELDLGGKLHTRLAATLGAGGTLQGLIETCARAHLRFEALEAYRSRANSGVTQATYDALVGTIEGTGTALPFDTLSMDIDHTLLAAVPFTPSGTSIPVPLLLIHVGSLGVVSYFPFRPGGAMRFHLDAQTAGAQFLADLKASHAAGDLGWFSRQLPITEINQFRDLLREEPRPEGLSLVAGYLYDSFHSLFPQRTLEHLRFINDPKPARALSLVQALTYRHTQHYQANLGMLATGRSERDLQGVIDGAAAMATEIMELLMTPVPGGVTGLNRLMQLVVFGNLAYSLIIGINEAAKGQASDFAAAMTDVVDLAINGLLISTAGRVHRQRIEGLLQRLGDPRKVPRSDGTLELWKPDITPYAIANQRLLDGQMPNAQGLYLINGEQYALVQQGSLKVVAQVTANPKTLGFVLKRKNGNGFAAPVVFNPKLQAWVLDLHGAGQLTDAQLIGQMLPNGEAPVPAEQVRNLLRSTAVPRAILDSIWAGEPPPVNLVEASRRVQVDRVIEQLSSSFHRSGSMPAHAGSAVFGLLVQLPGWPAIAAIHVHDQQGRLLESHAANEATTHAINLKRKDDGTYIALDAPTTSAPTQEALFELIIRQQPANSTLGKEGSPNLTEAQRIARLRLQISGLASKERIALFRALTRYAGQARHQVPADDPARIFVPIKARIEGVEVTPLLSKLQAQFQPLSPANLYQLLEKTPLDPKQQSAYLNDATLPANVREHLEQHRTALRIDAVIDGLYHPRAFSRDTDQWAREFTASLLLERLKRHFTVTEIVDGQAQNRYKNTGPDDTTVELLHYGDGRYEAYDMRNAGPIPVSPAVDSFYLAIASVLQPHERTLLGMTSASDAQGLRNTLGDLMSERRSPAGLVSLLDYSLGQYQQNLVLPLDLQPNPEGLYDWEGNQLLPLYGAFYPVTYDQNVRKWRLKHPQKVGVDTPRLEHNRHGAWRLDSESPLAWDDHHLFSRLGSVDFNVDQLTAERILKITDTPSRALREVHCAALPPPPLLKDSSKRFGIERQVLHFIKAMTTYSATRTARPSLQLLLVCGLPQWPQSHVLELHDDSGRTVAHYPAANAAAPQKIRLSQEQSRSVEPLTHLVRDDALTRALLDELPEGQEERLFKLAKKIAEHAYRERDQLFNTLYAQSERSSHPLHNRLRSHYPALPTSALQALLDHATPKEIKQLNDKDQVPLRLKEQARLTTNDLRLNRAFEGLYLSTLNNPDSEKIILHALKLVPGWPTDLRVDIHQGSAAGPLLESAGYLAGSQRKILARVDGRYQAYDAEGRLITDAGDVTTDLLTALWRTLDDSQLTALGLDDSGDLTPLRTAIADLALDQRVAIKDLLGLPHIPYWLQPPMPVHSTFTAYPFSLRNLWPFGGTQAADLVSKVRELYPRMSRADANQFIDSLNMNEPAALLELERRKAEYQALEFGLDRWANAEYPNDANDPLGLNLGRRRLTAQQILRAWRRETRQTIYGGLFDAHGLELQLNGNNLPDADFILGTRGFEHIEYLKISGDAFPPTGNDFLGKFTGLKSLRLDCMITELPNSITNMLQLEQLDLSDNNITLTGESRQRLAGMTRMEELNLDGNPLGLTPDVSAMNHLLNLSLQQTGISQWPIGAERLTQLHSLLLQDNQITTIPESLFTNAAMRTANRGTILHDNPLNAATLQRLTEYSMRTNTVLGGAMPGALHVSPAPTDFNAWLEGVPTRDHAQRKTVWEQLKNHEGASPDDVFRVLRDLTLAHDYRTASRTAALVARVWRVLQGMAESHELRETIFLNTYLAGTCGDGAILALSNMEILHRQHQAMVRPNSNQANRDLLELAEGLFYLRSLDRLADDHLIALRNERGPQGQQPDDVEVKLYLRLHFRETYNLPLQHEERLYAPGHDLTNLALTRITQAMAALKATSGAANSILMEEFWIKYLERSLPEPFATIDEVARSKLEILKQEVPDTRSMDYQERRQSIKEEKAAELNRLVSQLTRAAKSGAQRAD